MVRPVFKKGKVDNLENYRPIAILNNFSKVFERLLHQQLFSHMNQYISAYQHGFVPRRSTTTNLCVFLDHVANILDSGGQVDVIYTDISKAFDQLDHRLLVLKVKRYGLCDAAANLIASYLCDRLQFVTFNGSNSSLGKVTSGVPQGSILGPLLFVIYINDLSAIIPCDHLLYADDLKLFVRIEDIADSTMLQNALDILATWCDRNGLNLNVGKCKVMTFSRRSAFVRSDYYISGSRLASVDHFTDLGVVFDQRLRFDMQVDSVVAAALRSLGFIIRNTKNLTNTLALKTLYYAYCRAKLEYAGIVWWPHCVQHVDRLEGVQRRFLKYLYYKTYGNYPSRNYPQSMLLEEFSVDSLLHRSELNYCVFAHDLLVSKIDCSPLLARFNIRIPRSSSRYRATFYLPQMRTDLRFVNPIYNLSNSANRLECDIFNIDRRFIGNYLRN